MSPTSLFLALMEDMCRFAFLNKGVVEAFPLQTCISALVFSPCGGITRQIFKNKEPEWIILKPIVEEGWNSCLQTLDGHSDWVRSVVFSPNGQKIVSGSNDKTVKVWDATTGSLLQTLDSYSHMVSSVAFSPDGQKIGSGSDNKTVKVWDATMGSLLQTLNDHPDTIMSIATSLTNPLKTISINHHWVTINEKKALWLPVNR